MAKIQSNSLVEKLRREFALHGQGVGTTISEELVGVVVVADISGDDVISEAYPKGCFGSEELGAGGAGFRGKIGIQNPADSGVDLFVETVAVHPDANGDVTVRTNPTLPAGPSAGTKGFRDARSPGLPAAIIFGENATASLGTQLFSWPCTSQRMNVISLGVTLPPGGILFVQMQTTNSPIDAAFFWVERLLQAP